MQLSADGDGQSSAELIWSASLSEMLQPGLRAAAVVALDMAIIGAGDFLTHTLHFPCQFRPASHKTPFNHDADQYLAACMKNALQDLRHVVV